MEIFDFKCKYCGGEMSRAEGMRSVGKCKYCGSKQTLPKLYDEKRAIFFDRANHLRRNNEFDKAEGLYEQILNEDPTDPEAYWSLVLCRYGIEYVEEATSRERKPTVNRTQLTSIFADENYKSAIKYADSEQKKLYEREAKAINEIQKGILEISRKEEPFDVFICYKETDEKGKRSVDSVLAHELYRELTRDGYKVFFARETLHDKTGSAYEPYIFSALSSAKVMVVLGTKKEHFEAAWVRNEWSRFLGQIKKGEKKVLFPVYRDMDAYDLPVEFANLQALDMDRLGYLQELISGVENIVKMYKKPKDKKDSDKDEKQRSKKASVIISLSVVLVLIVLTVFIIRGMINAITGLAPDDTGETDSQDQEYTDNDIGQDDIPDVLLLRDNECGITVESKGSSFPQDASLEVVTLSTSGYYTDFSAIPENMMLFDLVYDISITENGQPYTHDGDMTVTLPIPYFSEGIEYALLYAPLYGVAVEVECTVRDGVLSFVTNRGGAYIIAEIYVDPSYDTEPPIYIPSEGDTSYDDVTDTPPEDETEAPPEDETETPPEDETETPSQGNTQATFTDSSTGLRYTLAPNGSGYEVFATASFNSSEIVIPKTCNGIPVTAIGNSAFSGCSSLTSITIPEGVTKIDFGAFYKCTSLTSINIPDSVTIIGNSAFEGCLKLTSINIPDSVTSIGNYAFNKCESLTSIVIPDGVTKLGECAFSSCSSLESINIPENITSIGDYTFNNCKSLTSIINIPNGVTTIGKWAFAHCSSLTFVTVPDGLTSIGDNAFYYCVNLASINIPDSVESIGENAFASCTGITSISIPKSLTNISTKAFSGCSGIKSITIPNSITAIGEYAFYSCSSLQSISYSGTASEWNKIEKAEAWDKNTGSYTVYYTDGNDETDAPIIDDTNIPGENGSVGLYYTLINNETEYEVSDIGTCTDTEIVIPSTFVGKAVTSIGDSAFTDRSSLTSISIPESVTSIGVGAFYGCSSLTNINIPNSVTSIGSSAFAACSSLKSIYIPESVTSISDYPFEGCSNLTSITFDGTVEQWNSLDNGTGWLSKVENITIYCLDGDIAK